MKKTIKGENYLEKIPVINGIQWNLSEDGKVTLAMENRGVANKIAQKLFKKPEVSYIHLDEMGSFIWQRIDGENNLITIGESIREHFGDAAEPLYERLIKYIVMLEDYKFITFKLQ